MFNRVPLRSTGTMMALLCALSAVTLGFLAACDSPSFTGVEDEEAQATYTAESPDAEPKVLLRGDANTDVQVKVLIYLDGELLPEQPELSSLDPDHIESIEVIKGEAATAIDAEAVDGLVRIYLNELVVRQVGGFVLNRTVPLSSPIEGATLNFSLAEPLDQSLEGATFKFTEKIGGI